MHTPILGALRICSALSLFFALTLVGVQPSSAAAPPAELDLVCIDAQDDVLYVATPHDCSPRETLVALPGDGSVRWCADHLGRLTDAPGNGGCSSHAVLITVPDDGPVFVCARIVQGGSLLTRGGLRTVADVSQCDPHEIGMVTPAAPEGVADTYTVDEDTRLVIPAKGVLDNDRDLTGDVLSAHLVNATSTGVLDFDEDGGFSFDPRGAFEQLDQGESASTTFSYVADDGALTSSTTTVTVVVTGRNDRPVAHDDVLTVDEDSVLQLTPPGLLSNDTDAESDALTTQLVSGPGKGKLTLTTNGGLTFDPRADFQSLGAAPGDDGTATFEYVAKDGTVASDAATVTVHVTGVNDAPVGVPDSVATDENTPLVIAPGDLLGNDTDAEGSTLSLSDIDFPSSGSGTLTTLGDGSLRFDPTADTADADSVPDFDHLSTGQDATVELTYRADDGTLRSGPVTVRIVVHGISAPTAADDLTGTDEDHAVSLDLLGNDQVEGGALAIDAAGTHGSVTLEHDGVVRYDPRGAFDQVPAGSSDTDTFHYTLTNDEGSSTGLVTVLVRGVNDAPRAVDDSYAVRAGTILDVAGTPCADAICGVLANDVDVDTPPASLDAELVSPPGLGRLTLRPNGGFAFDPAGDFTGTDDESTTFSYHADDGLAESPTATVTLTVGSNVAPTFTGDPYSFTVVTTDPAGSAVGTVTATDADGDALTYQVLTADSAAFELDASDGQLTVGPGGSPGPGTYHLTIVVSDGSGGSDQAAVTVRVVPELNAVDDAFTAVGNTELVGGTPPAGTFTARAAVRVGTLLANDGGTSGTVATQSGTPTAAGGRVTVRDDGSFVYTPPVADPTDPSAWDGSATIADSFDYQLTAGAGVADPTGHVSIAVRPPVWYVDNAAPGAGTGTAWDPFGSLAGVSGDGADRDLADQTVFLFGHADDPDTALDETVYPSGIALEDGQHLVGQGAGLTADGIQVVTAGPSPRVDGTTAVPAVQLAEDDFLRGFTVGGPGAGIQGDAVGALDVQLSAVAPDGQALDLAAGSGTGSPDVHIGRVASTHAGISLDGLSGTVAVTDASLADVHELVVSGETGLVDVGAAELGPGSLTVSDTAPSGTVRFGSVTGSGEGAGIDLTGNDGSVVVEDVDLAGLHGRGLAVRDETGSVRVVDGSIRGDSETTVGALLAISGATTGSVAVGADVALQPLDGHVDTRSGRSIEISGVGSSGEVVMTGRVVDRGLGVRATASSGAISLSGGMDLATGSSTAFDGSGLGTLQVVSPGSTAPVKLVSTTATTLRLVDVGIGAAGARFSQVDGLPGTASAAPAYGIDIDNVHATGGPGLVVNDGTVQLPAAAGARVQSSSGVTLRGLLVDNSAGDGIDLSDVQGVTLDGVQVSQADAVGIAAVRSGDVHLRSTSVSASGGSGVTLRDLEGLTDLTGSQISDARGIPLVVADGTASTTTQDAVALDSTVVSGGAEENDSISVTAGDDDPSAPGAADLQFRVSGATPSGSIGGSIGLDARATAGAALYVGLQKLAIADTASDGIRLGATGTGTALDFDMATMDSAGGGGIQLVGGAGIRAVGDGDATIGGTMNQVKVVTSVDSGVVLDRVSGVSMNLVSVASTPRNGIEITRSASVSIDQADVSHVRQHGLAVSLGTDITVDDSRFDLRPAPAKVNGTAPDFSAIWMRHLGGSANAVTDTTLRGSTGDQLMILEGTSVSALPGEGAAPADAPTTATVKVSGLTAVDTAIDYDTSDASVPDGNAVTALAGTGADLTIDLDGSASRTDETVSLGAEAGGSLTVTGGHAIVHQSVDTATERASSEPDPTMSVTSTGAGSHVRLGLDGLALTQSAPTDPSSVQPLGSALVVSSDTGGSIEPVAGGLSLEDSSIVSLGNADAVHLVAGLPGPGASTFDVRTSGLDVGFAVPVGATSTADAVSVVGLNGGVVDNVSITGGHLTAGGGHALRLYTEGTPGSFFPPVPPLPEGTIASATVDGASVVAGSGDAITGSGQLGDVTIRNTMVSGGSGSGIALTDASCVDLAANDTSAIGANEFGYVLTDVGLADYAGGSVATWLTGKGNVGPAAPWFVAATGIGGC